MIHIVEDSPLDLGEYARIPIAYRVATRFGLQPVEGGLGGLRLVEEWVEPYLKDYDAITGESPADWAGRWDLSTWGLLAAYADERRVGSAAIAPKATELQMVEARDDIAVLCDIRVHPEWRQQGIGSRLFSAAAEWARRSGCHDLIVETQNVNVPACRFYARQGCELAAIDTLAYPPDMEEIRLLWRLRL